MRLWGEGAALNLAKALRFVRDVRPVRGICGSLTRSRRRYLNRMRWLTLKYGRAAIGATEAQLVQPTNPKRDRAALAFFLFVASCLPQTERDECSAWDRKKHA